MTADGMTEQGTRASAARIVTSFSGNIPAPSPEYLIENIFYINSYILHLNIAATKSYDMDQSAITWQLDYHTMDTIPSYNLEKIRKVIWW